MTEPPDTKFNDHYPFWTIAKRYSGRGSTARLRLRTKHFTFAGNRRLSDEARTSRHRKAFGRVAAFFIGTISAATLIVPGNAAENRVPVTNVFEMPARAALQQHATLAIIALFRQRRYIDAEQALRQLIDKFPTSPVNHYNLAASLARQNKTKAALDSLDKAIDLGFTNLATMKRDPDLESLHGTPRFQQALDKVTQRSDPTRKRDSQQKTSALVELGRAIVGQANTAWIPRGNTLLTAFTFAPAPATTQIHGGDGDVSRVLKHWYDQGKAAGNHGDLYDNRDNGHSALARQLLPQVSHIEYGHEARTAGVHYGVNGQLLFNAITFGNSSTALTGPALWRSQARLAMTTPSLMSRAYRHYINDHLYIFPEHNDHDPEHGDLFPANTPYMIVSQGSSGSDRPFLHAVGAMLAAFKPDVKAYLRAKRLVMPTIQMLLRANLKPATTIKDYFSARAHPSVFNGRNIDLERLVRRANALDIEDIPPRVEISVTKELAPKPGVDYFGPTTADEVLFTTPGAVARVVRSTAYERRMVISTARTAALDDRPLTFTWKILRGDSDRIRISPLNADASRVELRVPWHTSGPVPFRPELTSSRVDIAVFASNGKYNSAPAFLTFFYPPHQKRTYNRAGRILEIDYAAADLKDKYADPVLFAQRKWRDSYRYTDTGDLVGWDRTDGIAKWHFTRHGARVIETDKLGRPTKAEMVRYAVQGEKSSPRQFVEIPTGKFVFYRYRDGADLLGEPSF